MGILANKHLVTAQKANGLNAIRFMHYIAALPIFILHYNA
jgi:hypothetical protein